MQRRRQSNEPEALPPKRQAAAALARRTELMREIAILQEAGQNSRFIANAEQLLTRWWAAANWKSRGELLKTADWLLRVEQHRA
ncbi:MAG: hypothetical protein QOF14_2580 [Hyphomicrobiales bacterium]|nr:hypothetical protein [Hyphomicrobiales bacterium]